MTIATCKKIEKKMEKFSSILQKMCREMTFSEKLSILNEDLLVEKFLEENSCLRSFLPGLSLECEYVIKSVIIIEQADHVFSLKNLKGDPFEAFRTLLQELVTVEKFYSDIGGIIGYQKTILQLLASRFEKHVDTSVSYHSPMYIDLTEDTQSKRIAVLQGILNQNQMAEIYPLGGAADRLHLQDPLTGSELPAAKLNFAGKSMLAHLIEDLQGREYLYYKLFSGTILTPVCCMTSLEKNNHAHVIAICEENNWFGRPKESFFFITQPLVPTFTEEGDWCLQSPLKLLLKPGGHGVIWKLGRDKGLFTWLKSLHRKKMLVRQINNPIADTDGGILPFSGIGCASNMIFGFSSCPKEIEAAEGVNVLIEKQTSSGYEYVLTNIEYCDFEKYGISDSPIEPGGKYSRFSSNTNILFADIEALEKGVEKNPFPGMLVNLKNVSCWDGQQKKDQKIARLESIMQNIADAFGESSFTKYPEPKTTSTFITYNHRSKTISTIKRAFIEEQKILETPESCLYDLLKNHETLLRKYCGFDLPTIGSLDDYLTFGPSFLFFYHPSLGPLYSVIGQKIFKGRMGLGSELRLDIADIEIRNLSLQGSLIIRAENVTGYSNENGEIKYSDHTGKCFLENVRVSNKGINRKEETCYWKKDVVREGSLEIFLHGNSEFYAQNVCLHGDLRFEVEDGYALRLWEQEGALRLEKRKIDHPSWRWKYSISKDFHIVLEKEMIERSFFDAF